MNPQTRGKSSLGEIPMVLGSNLKSFSLNPSLALPEPFYFFLFLAMIPNIVAFY
jgi:hypothetical protein